MLIIMMTIIIAAIPNSRVAVDARPVGCEAVGAAVGAGPCTTMTVSAVDPQYPLVPEKVAVTVYLPGTFWRLPHVAEYAVCIGCSFAEGDEVVVRVNSGQRYCNACEIGWFLLLLVN